MLLVDSRAGSINLAGPLKARGLSVELTRLEFGDVMWLGNGPDGEATVAVGVEYKTIWDVLKCVTDARYTAHQLPGMLNMYQHCWLLLEGKWRPCMRSGVLQIMSHRGEWRTASVGQRTFMYRDFIHWLCSVQTQAGVRLFRVHDNLEAVAWLAGIYGWWRKPWSDHRTLAKLYSGGTEWQATHVQLVRPSMLRHIAAQLPGIGQEKSASVERHFGTTLAMCAAEPWEWEQIPGIGKTMAQRIVKAIRGDR